MFYRGSSHGGSHTVCIGRTFKRTNQAIDYPEPILAVKLDNLQVKTPIVDYTVLEHERWGHEDPFPHVLSDQS